MLDKFITDLTGKVWKVTGPDAGQCTAVAHEWETRNGLPIVYGNAKDTYANAGAEYTKSTVPAPGMIAVFGAMPGNTDGHTGVVTKVYSDGTYDLLQQNDPFGSAVHIKRYDPQYLTGFFGPAGENTVYVDQARIDNLEKAKADYYDLLPKYNDAEKWKVDALNSFLPLIKKLQDELSATPSSVDLDKARALASQLTDVLK